MAETIALEVVVGDLANELGPERLPREVLAAVPARCRAGEKANGPGELMFTSSVTCASDGTIVNADSANNRVQAWDATGAFLWTVSGATEHEPPMRLPADVAVDEAGNVWVVDRTRLLVFDREQRLVSVWRPREHGLGRDPMSIVLDGQGHAYVGFPFQDQVIQLTLRSDALPGR